MNLFRKILFPFSVLYNVITVIRNILFDKGILKSYSFNIPIICVGNLNVGGTGKTPQIEYLIRLLSTKYMVATLSRGYKRESVGYVIANENTDAKILGDEPFQYYSKFKNIIVAVDTDRKNGIENLLKLVNKPDIILLDDAFQHRKIKAGLYILLTTYNDLYCDDLIFPAGNLRESKLGYKRANIVVVTKCPKNISIEEQHAIAIKLKINDNQQLFFSFIEYDDKIFSKTISKKVIDIVNQEKLLVAGIANPKPFFEYLKSANNDFLEYPDHHNFSKQDICNIKLLSKNRIVITTEKDFVRLKNEIIPDLFYLPIKSEFIDKKQLFDNKILAYTSKHI